MKAFTRILQGCACLGAIFVFSSCASLDRSSHVTIPQGTYWGMLAEVHGNTVKPYPADAIVSGAYLFPFENLSRGDVAIIRTDDGGTALATVGTGSVTRESYVAKAIGLYSVIGSQRIPLSYWEGAAMPGTTRVLFLNGGKSDSMRPVIPRGSIVALTLGFPYRELKSGETIVFFNPSAGEGKGGFTVHSLEAEYFGRWTTQGVNNAALPTRVQVTRNQNVITMTTWSSTGIDPYTVNAQTYIGRAGKVWKAPSFGVATN